MDQDGYFIPSALVHRSPSAQVAYMALLREHPSSMSLQELAGVLGQSEAWVTTTAEELKANALALHDPMTDRLALMSSGRLLFTGFVPAAPSKNKKKNKKEGRGDLERESEGKPLPLFERVVALYHAELPELPTLALLSNARRAAFRQRAAQKVKTPGGELDPSTIDFWADFFAVVHRSDFLMGRKQGDRKWRASWDFLLSNKGFAGVIEGKYENRA